jgi:hypothetical protein
MLTELPDDLPQVVRVFLDDQARLLQAQRFRRYLPRAWLFWRSHILMAALLDAKLSDRNLANRYRIAGTALADLHDLVCDDL